LVVSITVVEMPARRNGPGARSGLRESSPTFEFMIGVGPSISRTLNGEDQSTTASAAFTLDFMFWPTPNVGWFLEPTWTVKFGCLFGTCDGAMWSHP
jgi:hypothetical protein